MAYILYIIYIKKYHISQERSTYSSIRFYLWLLHISFTLFVFQRLGFLIIGECPSVDTENFSPILLARHKDSLSELIRRDKNRPSVIMWSIANEPRTQLPEAGEYFKQVAHHTKSLDPTRPITIAMARAVQVTFTNIYIV